MYRVLIVDDEKVERECVSFLAQGFSLPLEIREAADGADALEILKEWPADILCTDVQMPVMDGLALARRARELLPELAIIIFSGFAEFEYARTALMLGAVNYILKPIVPEELLKSLTDIIRQLEHDRDSKEQKEHQETLLLQYALQQAINGNAAEAGHPAVREKLASFCRLLLLEFDSDFLETHYQVLYRGLRTELGLDMESLNLSPTQALLFLRADGSWADGAALGKAVLSYIEEHFQVRPCLCVGDRFPAGGADAAPEALQEAFSFVERRMEQRFWAPDARLFAEGLSYERNTPGEETDDSAQLENIRRALSARDGERFCLSLDALLDKYSRSGNQSQIYVKFMFSNLITALYPAYAAAAGSEAESPEKLITDLYVQPDVAEILKSVRRMADRITESFSAARPEVRKEVALVKEYIAAHYGQPLSAELLAATVYLTPDYLSRLFKKTTGKGLAQYIRQERMERASRLLLSTTRKVIDIGVEVGYPNYSYFCQSFREYFGSSPEKYRQEGGRP